MHTIHIRPAAQQDLSAVHEITQEAFKKYAYDLGRGIPVKALADTPETLALELQHKHLLIGEIDGETLGSIRYEIVGGIAYFSRFGVKLQAQGCGMGRALVQAVVREASDAGCRAVALHTSAQMPSLIRFYYGLGFFIHSINPAPGYYRALLVRPFDQNEVYYDYAQSLLGK